MKHKTSQQEHGQILVILVLALVGLLAFTALAIDVGMVFSDRRYDQNVADSVALAGSAASSKTIIQAFNSDPSLMQGTSENFSCPPSDFNFATYIPPSDNWQSQWSYVAMHDAFVAAQSRGKTNGFIVPAVFSETAFQAADQGIYVKCVLSVNSAETGFYTYSKVSSTTQSSFAHFIFGGPLKNTVTAVAMAKPFISIFGGYALISMDPDSCGNGNNNDGGIWFDGTSNVTIHNGGALSDSCMAKNGSGSGSINLVNGGTAEYFTGSPDCDRFYADGQATCTQQTPDQITRIELPQPDCDKLDDNPTITSTTMWPGHYTSNVSFNGNNFNIEMKPGLYCFDGDFTATATGMAGTATIVGKGVTIYMKDGLFSMTGQANYILSAPFAPDPGSATYESDQQIYNQAIANFAWPGFLVIFRYSQSTPDCQSTYANISNLKMEGTSTATYTGTVYAPCSQIDFGGTSDLVNSTAQLIGNTIKLHGSPTSDLYYDASKMGLLSPVADLIQ